MARTKDFDEDEVLNKAVELFWRKGYNATSMQDVVEALGISRSSLYDTYGDKHALFIKALARYQAGSAGLCKVLTDAPSAKQAIRSMLEMMTGELCTNAQGKGCFMVNAGIELASHDDEVRNIVRQTEEQSEEAFFAAIKKGQANGEISEHKDARALARFVTNTIKGIRVSGRSHADEAYYRDIIDVCMSVF